MCVGGEGGIRTHERLAALVVFKTTALVHYATSPKLRRGWDVCAPRTNSAFQLHYLRTQMGSRHQPPLKNFRIGIPKFFNAERVGFEPTRAF